MKKTLLKITLGCVALATLAACSSDSEPQTYPNTFPSSKPASSTPSKEDKMDYVVDSENIDMPRHESSKYAAMVCEELRDGFTSQDIMIFRLSEMPEIDVMDHATLVGASVGSHCPEFMAQVSAEWP